MSTNHFAATFHGSNSGLQLGQNPGVVNNYCGSNNSAKAKQETERTPFVLIPFAQDPDFVNRGDILARLSEKCSYPAARAALVGLGGVGKSQLAIQFAYQVRETSPDTYVFWVHASSKIRFEESYRRIAVQLELPRANDPSSDVLHLVEAWLCDEQNGKWFMIVDNADKAVILEQPATDTSGKSLTAVRSLKSFLPQSRNGSILFTSRNEDTAYSLTGSYKNLISVAPMTEQEGRRLLQTKLVYLHDKTSMLELLDVLDYMPLAITQAAAYINRQKTRGSIEKYLELFRLSQQSKTSLLRREVSDIRRDAEAKNSIIITWQLAFEQIQEDRPSAVELLSVMSFFDRQGIPEFVLRKLADDQQMGVNDDSGIIFEEDISLLQGYCLITVNVNGNMFEMHRLVQFATREWLAANNTFHSWRAKFLKILKDEFPLESYEDQLKCQVLFPHALAAASECLAENETEALRDWSTLLYNAARHAHRIGEFADAQHRTQVSMKTTCQMLVDVHLSTIGISSFLAAMLLEQGKYEATENIIREMLARSEKVFGINHRTTLYIMHTLATVLRRRGNFETAEKMYRQGLERYEETHVKNHPNALSLMGNTAIVLRDLVNFEAAERTNRQELELSAKVQGKEHPSRLKFSVLTFLLSDQEKYAAAERLCRRVLSISEELLGKYHPYTLSSVHSLATILQKMKSYKPSAELYVRACSGYNTVLGSEHPTTIQCKQDYQGMLGEL